MDLFFYAVIHVGVSIALTASLVLVYFKIRKEEFLLYWGGFWASIGLVLLSSQILQPRFPDSPAILVALSFVSGSAIFLYPLLLFLAGIAVRKPLPPSATKRWILLALVLGWALETAGIVGAAAVTAAVLVLSLALVFLWVPAVASPAPVRARPERHLNVVGGPPIPAGFWSLVLSRFLFLLGIFTVGRFLLFLVAERLGIPAASAAGETGGLLAMFTLVTAVAALLVGPVVDRSDRRRLMAAGAVVAGSGIAAYLASAGLAGVVAAGTLMSIGTAIYVTANWAALTDLAPPEDAGRLMGLANSGAGGAAACAGLLGPAIDTWGFTPTLVLAAVAALVALLPLARIDSVPRLEESTT